MDCLRTIKNPVMLISEAYPGVWLEHVYDAVLFSKLEPAYLPIAQNTIELFIDNQREDGQLPCFVLWEIKEMEILKI